MKTSDVSFARLQKTLGEMGFASTRDSEGWRFEHPASDTVFLFRAYQPKDRVYEHDLFLVRSQLSARGLMSNAVEELLTKTPA